MIHWSILKIRDRHYSKEKHVRKAEVPTICVGNITVGGTGKTPHTELLLRTLQESDEWASGTSLSSLAGTSAGAAASSR